MRKKISQADARRLRAERDEAREALRKFTARGTCAYAGVDLSGITGINAVTMANLRTARKLGFALFTIPSEDKDAIYFRAVKP
jgi:hypothetical protein